MNMYGKPSLKRGFPGLKGPLKVSVQGLVRRDLLVPEEEFIQVIEPRVEDLSPSFWVAMNRENLADALLRHGAILLRGFHVPDAHAFREVARSFSPMLLDYAERAASREEVLPQVFTSTEMAADQEIFQHHEMSFSDHCPERLFFYCQHEPQEGGRTPLTNDRKILGLIDERVRRRFIKKKVLYQRNYRPGFDTWQDSFQTEDPAEVNAYCDRHRIRCEWVDRDHLRTYQVRQAVAEHPRTGETVWFNHAHLFHSSSLQPQMLASLRTLGGPRELPRNAFFGDGSSIPADVLHEIRDLYRDQSVRFTWQRGDVLILDNFLASHGREPFTGSRRILVAMADLHNLQEGF